MKSRKATHPLPAFPNPSGSAPPWDRVSRQPYRLQGAGAGVLSSAFLLGTRRAGFVQGQVDPECTSETRGGLGEYADALEIFTCGSALSSCSALLPLPGHPCSFPFTILLDQHRFSKPRLPLPLFDGSTGCCPAGVSGGTGAQPGAEPASPAPNCPAPFPGVTGRTFEVRAYSGKK